MLSLTLHSFPPYDSSLVCITYKGCPVEELLMSCNCGGNILLSVQHPGDDGKSNLLNVTASEGIFDDFCVSSKDLDPNEDQLVSMFSALNTTDDLNHKNQEKSDDLNHQNQKKYDVSKTEEGLFSTKVSFAVKMKKNLNCVKNSEEACSSVADYLMNRIKTDDPVDIFCTECDKKLTSEMVTFEKVSECCEGMSSELSENWFCHAEATAPQAKTQTSQLLCFDSSSLYLHTSIVEKLSVQRVLKETALACSGCRSVLTPCSRRPGKSFTGFFCDKVELRCAEGMVEKNYALEITWAILRGMVDDSSPVCKLYLHSKGQTEERCLLLCIRFPKALWFSARCQDLPSSVSLEIQEAYPISFLGCKPGSKLVNTWRHDFQVDFYYVSDFMLTIVEEYLVRTSEMLPNNLPEYLEGFRESFLQV